MRSTNLQLFTDAFGWQGGTIHQVSEELRKYGLSKKLTEVENLLKMNSNALTLLILIYKTKKEQGGNK